MTDGTVRSHIVFWDGELDGEPAVRAPAVTCPPSFDHRLSCI